MLIPETKANPSRGGDAKLTVLQKDSGVTRKSRLIYLGASLCLNQNFINVQGS